MTNTEEITMKKLDTTKVKKDDIMCFTYFVKVKDVLRNGTRLTVCDVDDENKEINVDGKDKEAYQAFAAGFEYTFYQAFGTGGDVGVIVEYLWDSRGQLAPSASESDIFVGLRWEGNDISTTRILMGVIFDTDTSARVFFVEASRRIGDRWRITLDGRFFLTVPINDPLYAFRRDDFIQLRLARFF